MTKNVLMIVYTDYAMDARVRREAETLAALADFDVTIITPRESHAPKKYTLNGVTLVEVNEKKYDGENKVQYFSSYLKFLWLAFLVCNRLLLKGKIDVVHIHNMPDFLVFSAILPRLCGKKIVLDIHDSMPETYLEKFRKNSPVFFRLLCLEEALSAALAHKVVCVNQPQKQILIQRGIPDRKILISLNTPDPKLFKTSKNPKKIKQKDAAFKIVYYGTIAKRLGADLTVRAVAVLEDLIPEIEFHVWAKAGPELDAIEDLSKKLNISHKVIILRGGVPMEELAAELQGMDLCVIANRKGIGTDLMLPVKMLECVALGIPVIAPRLRCIQYYFNEDMVTFFEPGDVGDLAEAIWKLYQHPLLRKEQTHHAAAFMRHYGWDTHKNGLIELYRSL